MRTATGPSWTYDGSIFQCRYLAETGNRIWALTDKPNGHTIAVWYNPETDRQEVIPSYTSSIEEALLAWPDDLRPATWEGWPIECCIAALIAIRTGLPKVARRSAASVDLG